MLVLRLHQPHLLRHCLLRRRLLRCRLLCHHLRHIKSRAAIAAQPCCCRLRSDHRRDIARCIAISGLVKAFQPLHQQLHEAALPGACRHLRRRCRRRVHSACTQPSRRIIILLILLLHHLYLVKHLIQVAPQLCRVYYLIIKWPAAARCCPLLRARGTPPPAVLPAPCSKNTALLC